MGRWKYHLNPDEIMGTEEHIGLYCRRCKKVGGIVRSEGLLILRANNGHDTPELSAKMRCGQCHENSRVNIYKHLVRVNDDGDIIPPRPSDKYKSQW
jgi:hypothetical protein